MFRSIDALILRRMESTALLARTLFLLSAGHLVAPKLHDTEQTANIARFVSKRPGRNCRSSTEQGRNDVLPISRQSNGVLPTRPQERGPLSDDRTHSPFRMEHETYRFVRLMVVGQNADKRSRSNVLRTHEDRSAQDDSSSFTDEAHERPRGGRRDGGPVGRDEMPFPLLPKPDRIAHRAVAMRTQILDLMRHSRLFKVRRSLHHDPLEGSYPLGSFASDRRRAAMQSDIAVAFIGIRRLFLNPQFNSDAFLVSLLNLAERPSPSDRQATKFPELKTRPSVGFLVAGFLFPQTKSSQCHEKTSLRKKVRREV